MNETIFETEMERIKRENNQEDKNMTILGYVFGIFMVFFALWIWFASSFYASCLN